MTRFGAVLALVVLIGACASPAPPAASPTKPPTPTATAGQATQPPGTEARVTSAAQAAAIVLAANPLFHSIGPLQLDLVGQSAWYEAFDGGEGYRVVVTMGSGDCQAGCINRRIWTYSVSESAQVRLLSEEGDVIEIPRNEGTDDSATISVSLVAGPMCPVQQAGTDCLPRPLANVTVVVRDPSGAEIARGMSDEKGRIQFEVPGGAYYVEPQPVEGLMRQAEPLAVAVVGGGSAGLVMTYDTGIR